MFGDNEFMSKIESKPSVDPQQLADEQAAFDHLLRGTPIDPEVASRIEERANAITEEVRRTHGMVDIIELLRDRHS